MKLSAAQAEYWTHESKKLLWRKPWQDLCTYSFRPPVHIRWFDGGELNVSENCIDRHLPSLSKKTALTWVPDTPSEPPIDISYQELFERVSQWSHYLSSLNLKSGDRIAIYLPMVPEALFAMLSCARLGLIHTVVFAGFSPDSIADRMEDSQACAIISMTKSRRGGQALNLQENVTKALEILESRGTLPKPQVIWTDHPEVKKEISLQPTSHKAQSFGSETPLFILYTSGSTNKPKGVLHTSAGYLLYAQSTFEKVFQVGHEDVFWCTADVGWITGHSYLVYGPLASGARIVLFEGVPTYPTPARCWEIIEKLGVTHFYTAPTALRALMREGDSWVMQHSRKTLKVLGTVGEPINPEVWRWYHRVVGESRCPIVDTWWQTETGGILISDQVAEKNSQPQKPGSAGCPLPALEPVVLDSHGAPLSGECEGLLALASSWPGQSRTVFGNHKRFEDTYFSTYPGFYFTGDGCRRDREGHFWITGRVDDVLNVSGHRLGTAEIESSLVAHPMVAEAAVVGKPHDIKGTAIVGFVILKALSHQNLSAQEVTLLLQQQVRQHLSPIAKPDEVHVVSALPKTRSGKIMRRILRKLVEDPSAELGDISTLNDPSVVQQIRDQLRRTY